MGILDSIVEWIATGHESAGSDHRVRTRCARL